MRVRQQKLGARVCSGRGHVCGCCVAVAALQTKSRDEKNAQQGVEAGAGYDVLFYSSGRARCRR